LTKTGVSELVRALPANPTQEQLKAYEKAVTTLASKMTDAKIKAVKKALDCIKVIHDDLKKYLAEIKGERQEAIDALKKIHSAAKEFHATVSTGPSDEVYTYAVKMATGKRAWPQMSDHAAVPTDLNNKVEALVGSMDDAASAMQTIQKGEVGGKPLDLKNKAAAYQKVCGKFQTAFGGLPEVWAKLAALDP